MGVASIIAVPMGLGIPKDDQPDCISSRSISSVESIGFKGLEIEVQGMEIEVTKSSRTDHRKTTIIVHKQLPKSTAPKKR